jgi:phosphoglycolate phosphatase-like HAD superfamily hydrolase
MAINNQPLLFCFDFDGTLTDSMPFLENLAVKLISSHYQIDKNQATKQYRLSTGLPFIQQINNIFPRSLRKNLSVVKEFEDQKKLRILNQELFPETADVLCELKRRGHLVAVSSSTSRNIVVKYLKFTHIAGLVDEVAGYKKGFEKGKPHFNYLIKKLSIAPDRIIFIGDSLNDMQRCHECNISFVGRVSNMFNEADFKIRGIRGMYCQYPTISSLTQIFNFI